MHEPPDKGQWHVLDFRCDSDGSCALTIFVCHMRFHIIADIDKFTESSHVGAEYHQLLRDYQGFATDTPQSHHKSDASNGSDSGVDVYSGQSEPDVEDKQPQYLEDPGGALRTWMVAPLAENFEQFTGSIKCKLPQTLQSWYHSPTRFCELKVSDDGTEVEAVELQNVLELEQRMEQLLPRVTLPKYVTEKLSVKYHCASEFHVLQESDQPPGTAYHPCRVQHVETQEIYFFKVVDNEQVQTTKREIDVLGQIKKRRLRDQMYVPLLEGLVSFDEFGTTASGKPRIMGFLQTDIPHPTPLTMKLDTEVPQKKRNTWAKEADRMKKLLHQHHIIWGDAKADNFVVDKDENLWIIDFGGSYTEGWVDKELNETEEGDDMGTEKVVNALEDPVNNAQNLDEEEKDELKEEDEKSAGSLNELSGRKGKRRRADTEEVEEYGSSREAKASRKDRLL